MSIECPPNEQAQGSAVHRGVACCLGRMSPALNATKKQVIRRQAREPPRSFGRLYGHSHCSCGWPASCYPSRDPPTPWSPITAVQCRGGYGVHRAVAYCAQRAGQNALRAWAKQRIHLSFCTLFPHSPFAPSAVPRTSNGRIPCIPPPLSPSHTLTCSAVDALSVPTKAGRQRWRDSLERRQAWPHRRAEACGGGCCCCCCCCRFCCLCALGAAGCRSGTGW